MPLKPHAANNKLKGSTIQGGSVPGWTSAQNNVGRQAMMYLMGGGLSKAGAAGVIGNQYQESGLNPSEGGGYLSQWLGSRLANLQSFANQSGLPITSVEAQEKFVIHELKTSYPGLYSYLQSATDPSAAALRVSNEYERPAAAAANNANRQAQAVAAFNRLSPASGIAATGTGQGSGAQSNPSGSPSSILDLLTSPVSALGGWVASIAVTVVKDTAIGIGDTIIIPAWHWQQRSVMAYQQAMFQPSNWNMLLWTAGYWGLGYWLLFTDPNSGHIKPAPVRNSRLTRHARNAQAIPARRALIRPKDVKGKTPRKPKPHISTAKVVKVGTMSTTRPTTVKVTGYRADRERTTPDRSETGNGERKSEASPFAAGSRREALIANAEHRAGNGSRTNRRGTSQGGTGKSRRPGGNP